MCGRLTSADTTQHAATDLCLCLGRQATETAALWQPAPRVTDADAANDVRSLDRKLDQRLLLLLKSPGRGVAACSRSSPIKPQAVHCTIAGQESGPAAAAAATCVSG